MPDIYDIANQHRKALLAGERRAATEMVRAYGVVWQYIKERLDDLSQQIAQARAAGEIVNVNWLLRYDRLQTLQHYVELELGRFTELAEQLIVDQQRDAVAAAMEHALQLILEALGDPPPGVLVSPNRLPTEALTDLVGHLQDGSPLRSLLDQLGPEASQAVRDGLIQGVATGQNPRAIARQIRRALGGNLMRALTISRTEVLRSYREASRRTYQANSDVVKGWVWHCSQSSRTCAACWAMHGTFHRLDERLDDHVRGRCAMIPVTRSWRELGFKAVPETRREFAKGVDLFEQLSDADKERVLGKAAFQAYKAGAVKLQDFVGRKRSREWGTMRYTRSLRDILGAEEAKKWMGKVIDKQAMSQRMKDQWRDAKARRAERVRQIAAMSDGQLAAEIRRHQQAKWNPNRLLEHVKDHQARYTEFFGHPVGAKEIDETSKLVMQSWDRLFTSIEPDGTPSFTFAADWSTGKMLLTVTRTGRIRTLIPSKNFPAYLGRHSELVEVTERVRRTGI